MASLLQGRFREAVPAFARLLKEQRGMLQAEQLYEASCLYGVRYCIDVNLGAQLRVEILLTMPLPLLQFVQDRRAREGCHSRKGRHQGSAQSARCVPGTKLAPACDAIALRTQPHAHYAFRTVPYRWQSLRSTQRCARYWTWYAGTLPRGRETARAAHTTGYLRQLGIVEDSASRYQLMAMVEYAEGHYDWAIEVLDECLEREHDRYICLSYRARAWH